MIKILGKENRMCVLLLKFYLISLSYKLSRIGLKVPFFKLIQ